MQAILRRLNGGMEQFVKMLGHHTQSTQQAGGGSDAAGGGDVSGDEADEDARAVTAAQEALATAAATHQCSLQVCAGELHARILISLAAAL